MTAPALSAPVFDENPFVRRLRSRLGDLALVVATGSATLLVLGVLAIIVIDVVRGGSQRFSWTFLSSAPRAGRRCSACCCRRPARESRPGSPWAWGAPSAKP